MKLTFHGAAGEVTGSCYLLETNNKKYLIDCGMFQGGEFSEDRNWNAFGFDPQTIEAVILTHAHLDHTGRLPKLVKEGFTGTIYANPATRDLARLVMLDAVEIMLYNQKKNGIPLLYEEADVEDTMKLFKSVDYVQKTRLDEDVHFTFKDAGHILGSCFIRLELEGKIIVFSGDIGNVHVPIVRETANLGEADYLVLESTYGHTNHEDPERRIFLLQDAIITTIKRKGVLMIPAFSLERTQEILYEINSLLNSNLIPHSPIFLDSPMAAAATEIYKKYPQYFDEAAKYLIGKGDDLFNFPDLKITHTPDDSKQINNIKAPKIIIAGSGMMNGGRILHHLLRYLSDAKSMLLIIAYQARGTLGNRLLKGEKRVHIAEVRVIGAYSAHGDQNKLVAWVKEAKRSPSRIFLVHGDEEPLSALQQRLGEETEAQVTIAVMSETLEI
ncbi:MAG: MBL fold metallo-hydrolase [Candidatus Magasanikbacteria bacterium]|nr:MBL fold metallo-hydrolase [Candidatus Magasanikbacteria bacterium]